MFSRGATGFPDSTEKPFLEEAFRFVGHSMTLPELIEGETDK